MNSTWPFAVRDGKTREVLLTFKLWADAKRFMSAYHNRTGRMAYIVSFYY